MAKKLICFGDVHYPHVQPVALEILKKAVARIRPDITVCLGDLLDCGQFSQHPPTFGVPETDYEADLAQANGLIDFLQKHTQERTVLIEGNHEYRLDRWAAAHAEGRGAYNLLAPRIQLMRGRSRCTYVPYGSADGKYPHYKINGRIVAVHGWSYAQHATKEHLRKSQGKSILHGHCLPPDYEVLTVSGWKQLPVVNKGETVFGYRHGQIVRTRVTDTVYHRGWSGRMAIFDHPAIGQTMTELHGVYTRQDEYLHAKDAMAVPLRDLVRRAIPVTSRSGVLDISMDELRIIVAVCSDASFDKRWQNVRFHLRKPRKIKRLTELLDSAGYAYSVRPSSTYPDAVRINLLRESKHRVWSLLNGVRELPQWLLRLDTARLLVVVEELKHWDGSSLIHDGRDYGCRQFISHKAREIDLVQHLLAMAGYFSRLNKAKRVVTYNEHREVSHSTKTLGEIVEWKDVKDTDTACISTGTRNFITRTPSGSVELTGNTHRCDSSIFPNVWGAGTVQARSAGCLCKPIPLYGTGRPVEWVNAFIVGYLGRRSDTLFTVDIKGDFAILPDGTELRV